MNEKLLRKFIINEIKNIVEEQYRAQVAQISLRDSIISEVRNFARDSDRNSIMDRIKRIEESIAGYCRGQGQSDRFCTEQSKNVTGR